LAFSVELAGIDVVVLLGHLRRALLRGGDRGVSSAGEQPRPSTMAERATPPRRAEHLIERVGVLLDVGAERLRIAPPGAAKRPRANRTV